MMIVSRLNRCVFLSLVLSFVMHGVGCSFTEIAQGESPQDAEIYAGYYTFAAWIEGSGQGRSSEATAPRQLFVSEPVGRGAQPGTGLVYVFDESAPKWTLKQSMFDTNATGDQSFGYTISTKGNDTLFGAPQASNQGRAFVFTRSGNTWSRQAELKATDAELYDSFGLAVAIDGNVALVGAPLEDTSAQNGGSVYAFSRSGATWSQTQKLVAGAPAANDGFGQAILLNGTEALIGSNDPDGPQNFGGRVTRWSLNAGTWTEGVTIRPSDASYGKGFGSSLARDGNWLVVGAVADDETALNTGAAYVFERVGPNWVERQKLLANDGAAGHRFGISVSIDGDRIAVGAVDADGKQPGSGAVYVFERVGGTWSFALKLIASDGEEGDFFGGTCAVNSDLVAVGAPHATVNGMSNAGTGYIYKLLKPVGQARVMTEASKLLFGK